MRVKNKLLEEMMEKYQKQFEVIVIGAGPAGVSCAVWLKRLGINVLLVDGASSVGGLCALNPFVDEWNVTAPSLNGYEIAEQLNLSLNNAQVPVLLTAPITSVIQTNDGFNLEAAQATQSFTPKVNQREGVDLSSRFLVLATGVNYKNAPETQGKNFENVFVGATNQVRNFDFKNKKVAVLGGGDNAFENAISIKREGAKQITIFARTMRAQTQWLDHLDNNELYQGQYTFEPARLMVNDDYFDVILVMYGYQPQNQLAKQLNLALTNKGYLQTDLSTTETSLKDVYAIGELTQRQHPCVVTAMADGIVAAKAIEKKIKELNHG